ncbi:MAG: hypothetical protein Ct9H300mP11_30010 [Chloroflexota bacterium]|nr:MAG: hypothetical protein Ct9H300mP11_30010 [Chloroflexota bacterium]
MVMPDHVVQPKSVESQYPYSLTGDLHKAHESAVVERLEQVTTLAFLAGITTQIKLVTSVMIIPYRNPILTAKMLSTLDMLSKGRLILGAGVGWMEEEFKLLDTEPFSERGAVTNEYLKAFIELWTNDNPQFEGRYVNFSDITFLPKGPGQKPYPPIWIGGGSRPAIRRAAQIGDCWDPVGAIPAAPLEPEELSENLVLLRSDAEKAGRDPLSIQVSVKAPLYDANEHSGPRRRFTGTPDEVCQDVQTYADVGVTHLIFDFRADSASQTEERMTQFAEQVMAVT